MSRKLFFLFLVVFLPILNAEPSRLTVEEVVQVTVTNHLHLKAALLGISEAKARLRDSGRLSNPELETDFAPNLNGREYTFRIGFIQRFPLTSRLSTEKKISRLAVQLAEAEVHDFRRRIAFDARTEAVKLAANQESIRLHHTQLEVVQSMMNAYEQSVKAGEASPLDLAQLELSADQLKISQSQLESESIEARRSLALLMGQETNLIEIAGNLPTPSSTEPAPIKVDPVIYLPSSLRVATLGEEVALAEARRWEDVGLGLFTGADRREDAPDGLKLDHNVGVRFFLPIPLWNKREGAVAEAKIKAERAKLEAEINRRQTESATAQAQDQLRSAANRWTLINGELLAKSRNVEAQIQTFQKEGQVPFSEVIRARERTLQLQAAEVAARRDFHLARARQIWATGHITQHTK